MSVFSDAEIDYLGSQRLGRLATVGRDGMPHVVPVAFRYNADADSIDIGGHDFAKRKKFRDVRRTGMAALVLVNGDVAGAIRASVPPSGAARWQGRSFGPSSPDRASGEGFLLAPVRASASDQGSGAAEQQGERVTTSTSSSVRLAKGHPWRRWSAGRPCTLRPMGSGPLT